ncbi:hypothetical protein U1Q18_049079 [Sarracenia purpurea var. burkii]
MDVSRRPQQERQPDVGAGIGTSRLRRISKVHVWVMSSVILTVFRMYVLVDLLSRDSHYVFLTDWLIVISLTGAVFAMIADSRVACDMSHAVLMFTIVGVNIWMLFFDYIGEMFPNVKLRRRIDRGCGQKSETSQTSPVRRLVQVTPPDVVPASKITVVIRSPGVRRRANRKRKTRKNASASGSGASYKSLELQGWVIEMAAVLDRVVIGLDMVHMCGCGGAGDAMLRNKLPTGP